MGGGFSFQIVGGRERWRVMFGLGGGVQSFASRSERGPVLGTFDEDNAFSIGRTTTTRSIELRHAEVVARFQPFWGVVRPFAEAQVGLAVFWHTSSLENSHGDILSSEEEQRSAGIMYGGMLGIDWRLGRPSSDDAGSRVFVLTTGVKRTYTSGMERPRYTSDAGANLSEESARAPLAIWMPFLGVAFTIDNRLAARTASPLPVNPP